MVGAPSVLIECDGWWPEWLPGSDVFAAAASRAEEPVTQKLAKKKRQSFIVSFIRRVAFPW